MIEVVFYTSEAIPQFRVSNLQSSLLSLDTFLLRECGTHFVVIDINPLRGAGITVAIYTELCVYVMHTHTHSLVCTHLGTERPTPLAAGDILRSTFRPTTGLLHRKKGNSSFPNGGIDAYI